MVNTPVVLERWLSREQLEVVLGKGKSRILALGPEPISIGGGPEDHVFVPALAPHHARLICSGGLVQYVEPVSGRRATLVHGSWLEVGSLRLVVRLRT